MSNLPEHGSMLEADDPFLLLSNFLSSLKVFLMALSDASSTLRNHWWIDSLYLKLKFIPS